MYDDGLSDIVVSGEVNKTIGNDDDCVLLADDPENQVKCVNDSPTRYNVLCELLIFFPVISSLISSVLYLLWCILADGGATNYTRLNAFEILISHLL